MIPAIELPAELSLQIEEALEPLGLRLEAAKELAASVLKLSDFYISNPQAATPWEKPWAQAAYISYYMPLNYLRARFVAIEAKRLGFTQDLSTAVDVGSGLGSALLALAHEDILPLRIHLIEQSERAIEIQMQHFATAPKNKMQSGTTLNSANIEPRSLGIFSYSLTEMDQLPQNIQKFEALMLIEPSTREDGRELLKHRLQLLQEGFYAWAPCLHQEACPLLEHSLGDWCHHKLAPVLPEWLRRLCERLPMHTGDILSLSYLLLKKTPPPDQTQFTRVVGDPLKEKGKSRQLICRTSEREFLSWLKRDHKKPKFPARHDLLELPSDAEKAGNEVRILKGQSLQTTESH